MPIINMPDTTIKYPVIDVPTQEEFDAWMAGKKATYLVAFPDKDPSNAPAKPAADSAKIAAPVAKM